MKTIYTWLLFMLTVLLWGLVCFTLPGCASKSLPSPDELRRAKPMETARPDTTDVLSSVGTADDNVREVVRTVRVASGESTEQRNQIKTLQYTIEELNASLTQQDDEARARFASIQRQLTELEATRIRLADSLESADRAANEARGNLELSKSRIIRLEGAIALSEREKQEYKSKWESAVAVSVAHEEATAKANKAAAKNQYWSDNWWRWCIGVSILTSVAWVAGIIYFKFSKPL